LIKAGTL